MDLSKVTQAYVERLIENDGKPKMLLLDDDTISILSLAVTQSTILKKDVFMVDKISNANRKKMRHLDAIVFVRPVSESIGAIIEELRSPRYAHYTLVFTNLIRKSQLERLAEADDHEAVVRVQEMFMDWRKINNDLFSCGLNTPYLAPASWEAESLDLSCNALFALVGSLRMGHPAIRFDSNSKLSRQLAMQLDHELTQHSAVLPQPATNNLQAKNSVVLILDRFNDPITPLISHWTYQAMVDELLGITNNCVDLGNAPDVPPSHRQITLAQDQDQFFNDSMFLNFGDLGAAVREYVQHYSSQSKSSQSLDTVADIKKVVESLPEFRKLQDNTTKHVSLVGELSRIVTEQQLLMYSEVEQKLACNENHTADLQQIEQFITSLDVSVYLKYRLVALYGLRYRKHPHCATEQLLQTLLNSENSVELDRAVRNLLFVYSLNAYPQEDLFSQGSLLTRAQQSFKGLRGVENVYTQHEALLESILVQLAQNRLPREKYPYQGRSIEWEPQQIVIFIVAGVTMEEARIVGEFNKLGNKSVMLGGTGVVNAKRFLDALSEVTWAR